MILSPPVCACSIRTKPSFLLQTTCDEKQFRNYLHQPKSKHVEKTSSPIDLGSFILNSLHTDKTESQSCRTDIPSEVKGGMSVTLNVSRQDQFGLMKSRHHCFFPLQNQKDFWERLPSNWTGEFCSTSSRATRGSMGSRCAIYLIRSLR